MTRPVRERSLGSVAAVAAGACCVSTLVAGMTAIVTAMAVALAVAAPALALTAFLAVAAVRRRGG